MIFQAQLALASAGDRKALDAAAKWLKESRSHALALEGLRRNAGKSSVDTDEFYSLVDEAAERKAFQMQLEAGADPSADDPFADDDDTFSAEPSNDDNPSPSNDPNPSDADPSPDETPDGTGTE
jgi:hypothetical protein